MPANVDGVAQCPKCGGEVQATARLYLSLRREGWTREEVETLGVNEPHLYCENDHDLVELLDEDRYLALEEGAISAVSGSLADRGALDRIRDLLDLTAWNSDTVEEIAGIVRATGREVRDLPM